MISKASKLTSAIDIVVALYALSTTVAHAAPKPKPDALGVSDDLGLFWTELSGGAVFECDFLGQLYCFR